MQDKRQRKAYVSMRKQDGAKFPQIMREMHGRKPKADGGEVAPEMTRYERMRKAQQYRLRGLEPPAELMPTEADIAQGEEGSRRMADVGEMAATMAAPGASVSAPLRALRAARATLKGRPADPNAFVTTLPRIQPKVDQYGFGTTLPRIEPKLDKQGFGTTVPRREPYPDGTYLPRMADGGEVDRRRQKIAAYTSRGKEPSRELMEASDRRLTPDEQRVEERAIGTGITEATGIPSVMRGSENIAGGYSDGDPLRMARGAGEVVLGAAPGLGAVGRAGLGAASRVGGAVSDALYGSMPRLLGTTAASVAPGTLDDAYAETKADYQRTGSVGSEPSVLDAARRLVAGRDFTPASDDDFRRQYQSRNPMPKRMTEQEFVESEVQRFQESPGYRALIEMKAVTKANNQARDVALKAAEDYRKTYGQQYDRQTGDWNRQYDAERQRYLKTLNDERLEYQKKPFAERNPGINALTYVVPAAIAAQRYGAKIGRDATDVRRLMQIVDDASQPVTARIAAQKDLAEVLRKTPQTGLGKTLEGAKYGVGGGALSVLLGTGQDLADTFYLDPDSEARKRAAMKFVPINDQGETDFGPMKDMLKNNAQRMAIMAGAVGSVPLFKSGLSTAETTAANRVARGPDVVDLDAKRATIAKTAEIDRKGLSDRLTDAELRRELLAADDASQQNDVLRRALAAAKVQSQRAVVDDLVANGLTPAEARRMRADALGLNPPSRTNLPPTPAATSNPQKALPAPSSNSGSVSLDSGAIMKGLDAVGKETADKMIANQSVADAKLRSLISMQTGRPGKEVTDEQLNAARKLFARWASGKKDGGAVAACRSMKSDKDVIARAKRACGGRIKKADGGMVEHWSWTQPRDRNGRWA
jgi:hypothetical protein